MSPKIHQPVEWTDDLIKRIEYELQRASEALRTGELPDAEPEQSNPSLTSKQPVIDRAHSSTRREKFKRQPNLREALLKKNTNNQLFAAEKQEIPQMSQADSNILERTYEADYIQMYGIYVWFDSVLQIFDLALRIITRIFIFVVVRCRAWAGSER